MGVNCQIYLPANVRVDTVAIVVAGALGTPVSKRYFCGESGDWSAEASHVLVVPCGVATLAEIRVSHSRMAIDGQMNHLLLYHFEADFRGTAARLMMPRSRPLWLAVGHRLADFFGGVVDYQDCDDEDADYSVPFKPTMENSPEDDGPWLSLQERLLAVRPVTTEELERFGPLAAYGTGQD